MEEIRVIHKSDNDNFTPILQPQFVVLGMINEYCGRQAIEGDSTVELFYVDERPVADLFAKYLRDYGVRLGIDPGDVSVVPAATGHSCVESRRMNAHINALYNFEFENDEYITLLDGQKHRTAHVALSIENFPGKTSMLYNPSEMNPRFSYLYGAFLRFGGEGLVIEMANASQKIELIEQLLEELDVDWIDHRYTVGGAPTCHRVTFGADSKLTRFLQLALAERADAFAGATSLG